MIRSTFSLLCLLALGSTAQAYDFTGFYFKDHHGVGGYNETTIYQDRYTGECPGLDVHQPEGWFFTHKAGTAKNRTVNIRNISSVMNKNPYPYATERYSSSNLYSENPLFVLDTRHHNNHLSLTEGLNNFDFIVREKDVFIASGQFNANIKIVTNERERNRTCRNVETCIDVPTTPINPNPFDPREVPGSHVPPGFDPREVPTPSPNFPVPTERYCKYEVVCSCPY